MKKSKFSPNLIVAILAEHTNGASAAELSRKHGISHATQYNWKRKYGGMEARNLKKLKQLEEENLGVKHMYSELALDYQLAQEIIEKNPPMADTPKM